MQHDKLVTMANQIAKFFGAATTGARNESAGGAQGVADHINKYWEPRMRTQLFERIDSGRTEHIHPLVLDAAPSIRRPTKPLEERASSERQERGE